MDNMKYEAKLFPSPDPIDKIGFFFQLKAQ